MSRNVSPFGARQGSTVSGTWTPTPHTIATVADLQAIAASDRTSGQVEYVVNGGKFEKYYFHSTSSLAAAPGLVVVPTAGSGRWLRVPGEMVDLALPFTFATADGATLLTIPTGCAFHLARAYWDITTACSGGSSSAIGVAATGHTTAGDILGGAAGDVEATLTAGIKAGTVGAKMDTDLELHSMVFNATAAFTFERITSAFSAGAGNVCLVGFLLKNAGA